MTLSDLHRRYRSGELDKHEYIRRMHDRHRLLFEYQEHLRDSDIAALTITADGIVAEMRGSGLRLLVDPADSRFIPVEILNFKRFDPEERDLLFAIAERSTHICDVGANIGWYTLSFARLPRVETVFAFEPIPATFAYLERHLALNGLAHKVVAHNLGLADEPGERVFYWTAEEFGAASLRNIQRRERIEEIRCRISTLDRELAHRELELGLVKIDVEGAELLVLQGARQTLARHRPVIFAEMLRKWAKEFSYHPNDIIDLLDGLGYACYGYTDGRIGPVPRVEEDTVATNFFFFHRDQHRELIAAL